MDSSAEPPSLRSEALLERAANDTYQAITIDDEDEGEESPDEDVIWLREQIENHKALSFINRPSVYTLGLVICLFMLAMSSTIATKQIILFKLACNTVTDSKGYCDPVDTQLLVSSYTMYSMVGGTIVSLIPVAKVGELSDIYGRKPFFIIVFITFTLSHVLLYLIFKRYETFQFKLLLGATLLGNATGGAMIISALIGSYISDIVESHARIYALGLGMSSLFIGQSAGPIIGNWITDLGRGLDGDTAGKIGITAITQTSHILQSEFLLLKFEIIINIIICVYLITLFPESRNEKARQKSRANSVSSASSMFNDSTAALNQLQGQQQVGFFKKFFDIFSPMLILTYPTSIVAENYKHMASKFRFVVISLTIIQCIHMMIVMTLGQILMNYGIFVFDWATEDVGLMLTILSSTKAVVLIFVLPVFQNRVLVQFFKFKVLKKQLDLVDFSMMIIGYSVDALYYLLMVVAASTNQVYLLLGLFAFGSISGPATQSSLLKFYPTSKTGVVFCANSLLHNVVAVVAPVLFMNFYKDTLAKGFPSGVFLLYAAFMFLVIALLVISKKVLHLNSTTTDLKLIRSNSVISLPRKNSGPHPSIERANSSSSFSR
ncbi:hypothetical protein Cantr_00169 [Candida viswanathii]|uniref:Major facilitator superfamily (MFS) profile domain-containing protein n=1 Tax=Candida viswanathii TaxID=5486 RepID=A0A367YF85_9ASCO|nr:hypothetical protein Cantr_00169 [Candida viswanathii]